MNNTIGIETAKFYHAHGKDGLEVQKKMSELSDWNQAYKAMEIAHKRQTAAEQLQRNIATCRNIC